MERNVFDDPDDWESDASFALGSNGACDEVGSAVRLGAEGGWTYKNVPTGLDNALKCRSIKIIIENNFLDSVLKL
jgi:hypothetical protein